MQELTYLSRCLHCCYPVSKYIIMLLVIDTTKYWFIQYNSQNYYYLHINRVKDECDYIMHNLKCIFITLTCRLPLNENNTHMCVNMLGSRNVVIFLVLSLTFNLSKLSNELFNSEIQTEVISIRNLRMCIISAIKSCTCA